MNLDAFIDSAWADHAEHTQAVAERLAISMALVQRAEQLAPYARLLVHVFGEHLGEWQRGVELLQALPRFDDGETVVPRGIAGLRLAAGDATAADGLPPEERAAALALAASALAGRCDFTAAIAAYRRAVALAPNEPLADSAVTAVTAATAATRALAVAGNNLAAALEEQPLRSTAETEGMVFAAEHSLACWRRCGGWLEHERAEYRLANSLLKAGDAPAAAASAQRCIDICSANDANPFELFFGHAALALAQRASGDAAGFETARIRAHALLAGLSAEEQGWCSAELAALAA